MGDGVFRLSTSGLTVAEVESAPKSPIERERADCADLTLRRFGLSAFNEIKYQSLAPVQRRP